MDRVPEGAERHDVSDGLPRGMERRLVLRLLSYWRSLLRGGEAMPSFLAVDPSSMEDIWPHCFVLDVVGHEADPVFRQVGASFAAHSPIDLVGRRVSEAREGSLVHASVSYVHEIIAKAVPVSRGGEFRKQDGTRVLYRSIVLPMSDDGSAVSGLLCAANCREASES